ncbi:MAG: glutathione S-transferase family protein [Cyanobacteriota bacterium]|nr:glutathione S-transferase family protein [Cyanobacteriota bacterium]
MLTLHQFRHSAFCEKVRLVLAAKKLPYSVVEVLPGLGQLELFRLSGQRQVPVLVDGDQVVADSTAIALHLERHHPDPALLPPDPRQRARVLLLEDWADTTLASGCRLAFAQGAAADPLLRSALLPAATPGPLRQLVVGLPGTVGEVVAGAVAGGEREHLQQNLALLSDLVGAGSYLVGETLSLADLAVAAQLSLLLFPASAGAPLAGHGVAGVADNPLLEPLFRWRDRITAELVGLPHPAESPASAAG